MTNEKKENWAIYGGSGFIGQHLAFSILSNFDNDSVTLLDILSPVEQGWKAPLEKFVAEGRLSWVKADVRKFSDLEKTAQPFDVMVNLAAICREPGHEREEYFETNVTGAENLCRLAEQIECREIIFTSTISVYGVHDRPVDETTEPASKMPYGQSKIQAERIHQEWARRVSGRLFIIRPGVVFGPGEKGNVTRLVSEMIKRNRSIRIRPDQVKAGIYIEELLSMIHWLRVQPAGPGSCHLVNGVTATPITFNAYGQALERLMSFNRKPFTAPARILKLAAGILTPFSSLFPSSSKLHPRRITKLTLVLDVRATEVEALGYPFQWSLDDALSHWLEQGL